MAEINGRMNTNSQDVSIDKKKENLKNKNLKKKNKKLKKKIAKIEKKLHAKKKTKRSRKSTLASIIDASTPSSNVTFFASICLY